MVPRLRQIRLVCVALVLLGLAGTLYAPPFPRPSSQPATQPTPPVPAPVDPTVAPAPATRPVGPVGPVGDWRSEMEQLRPLGHAGRSSLRPAGGTSDFLPIIDRWRIGQPGGYVQNARGSAIDPYNQNVLKGDYPIIGQDKFLSVTVTSDTLYENRRLPVPSNVSSLRPSDFDFFGSGLQQVINENLIISLELFQGDTSYKPRDWELRITPVININYVDISELGGINPDFREGTTRTDNWIGFQELFFEKHLGDLSENYDFWAVRAGIQGFTSDFRGFLYSDNEPGIRLFGTLDNNQIQWNIAWFSQLEKDTNSGLNSYTLRDQNVFIANIYKQDFIFPGYTAQLSFHANIDQGSFQLDDNGFLVRPAPIGSVRNKDVRAYYFGWAGDGHIGRFNISHQFYQVFGRESFNNIAGQEVTINAQFFAIEVSYDQDWLRYRASFAWASGDTNPTDDKARGFDSIMDNPNFAGGGFSFFTRQAISLTGAGVGLVGRNSFFPSLRTSKEQGQANFVNPGIFMFNIGLDADITPKLKAVFNLTWLQFQNTKVLQLLLHDNKIGRDIGLDTSVGLQYRPFLNNNAIMTFGASALTPGQGFKDLYTSETLYSVFMGVTLTY